MTGLGGDVLFIEASAHDGHGRPHPDRPARRRDEGVGADRAVLRARARRASSGSTRRSSTRRSTCTCPAGATPKDGPSAGVTMVTALASLATGRPVRSEVGMTGEVTLNGRVLPIGGVKQKLLAAQRTGLTEVFVPLRNEPDLDDVPAEVLRRADRARGRRRPRRGPRRAGDGDRRDGRRLTPKGRAPKRAALRLQEAPRWWRRARAPRAAARPALSWWQPCDRGPSRSPSSTGTGAPGPTMWRVRRCR